jgi:deferrochelatase/peroxidase EfeB
MARSLNHEDIQGHVIRAYGRYSYPVARYLFLHVAEAGAGRAFVDAVRRRVTTATRWPVVDGVVRKPPVTVNIGFSFFGLYALGLPTETLQRMPEEFIDGMKRRAHILGDRDPGLTEADQPDWDARWDPIWRENHPGGPDAVHIWIGLNAPVEPGTDRPVAALDEATDWLRGLCAASNGGVRLLGGHGKAGNAEWQEASAIFRTLPNGVKFPTPEEHFGFTDAIGDPVFAGQLDPAEERERLPGRGEWMSASEGWRPVAAGEFVLGHADEAQELPPTAAPWGFMRNGSFMAYRKLHQNVGSFRDYWAAQAALYARVMGVPEAEAAVTLTSKAMGRWPDGVPLPKAPTHADWMAARARLGLDDPDPIAAAKAHQAFLKSAEANDFRYAADMPGYDAPKGCHLRRVNTRDYLDPLNDPGGYGPGANPKATTQLNKRRRILRRGLPYGEPEPGAGDDDSEQGVAMMAICASLFRQFEFVQQQWLHYGLDFNQGNHTCPIVGDHARHARFVIPSRPDSGKPPFICDGLRQFVETRGGEYFFLPSMTALKMIAMGVIDPT